jgi:hypothetical protein
VEVTFKVAQRDPSILLGMTEVIGLQIGRLDCRNLNRIPIRNPTPLRFRQTTNPIAR